jgi:hypothetical protein
MSGATVGLVGGVPPTNEATVLFYTATAATTARLTLYADPTLPGEASVDVPALFGVQPPQTISFPISQIDCATVPTQ